MCIGPKLFDGFYQKKRLGSASHQKRSQAGIVQFNALHAGFAKKKWFAIEEAKEKATDHGWHLCNLILSKYIMVFNVPL